MKFFAIFNMTIDHLGAYFFPEIEWLRAIGRITFPVWFFLVGYSRGRDIGRELWVYALLIVVLHPFIATPFLAMNALVTVILCRLAINWCEDKGWLSKRLPEVVVSSLMISLITMPIFEYGSIAFLFAILGRLVRNNESRHRRIMLAVSAYLGFIGWQFLQFDFDAIQWLYVVVGTAWVVSWLERCPNRVIWQIWDTSRSKRIVTVLSRNTLPYYFYHRVVFQIAGAWWLGKSFGFNFVLFNW